MRESRIRGWIAPAIACLLAAMTPWTGARADEPGGDDEDGTPPAASDEEGKAEDDAGEPAADPVERLERRLEELQAEVEQLRGELEEQELQRLLDKAESAANAPPEEVRPEDRTFVAASRSLQMTNPEISVAGDVVMALNIDEGLLDGEPTGTGFPLRAMSIDIRSVLDPYSSMKAAVEVLPDPEEPVALEELYLTWNGVIPRTSLSVGRFRHQFGVVNRWHEHDLDQVDYPLAMRAVIGDEGLSGDGLSFEWFMPRLWAHAHSLRVDVVDGNNEFLFSGERFSLPAFLGRFKNYWDLSEATYLELGLSGAYGWNHPVEDAWASSVVAGADLTLYWSPPKRAKYRSLTWRSEFYYAQKEDEEHAWDRAWGVYSYLTVQLGPGWFLGVRGDLCHPLEDTLERFPFQVTPYLTFWQSEFVFLRLEYGYTHGWVEPHAHRIAFQVSWAAGPHKHEKY